MKTITEFSGFSLKDALAKKATLLAEGKTEEEAQAAIHEQLKLADEAKVSFFKNAVDMTSSRLDRVKRVVIALKSNDQEKVPESFTEREGHFYLVEFFPQMDGAGPRRSPRGGRFGSDRFDSRESRKGRGRSSEARSGEGRSYENRDRNVSDAQSKERKPRRLPQGERAAHHRRNETVGSDVGAKPQQRKPRKPRIHTGPRGAGELRLVLKGQPSTTLTGSGAHFSEAASASAVSLSNAEGSSGSNSATS